MRLKYQYSALRARPLKTAYFLRHKTNQCMAYIPSAKGYNSLPTSQNTRPTLLSSWATHTTTK